MAKGKLEFLGEFNGKECYMDLRPTSEDDRGNEIPNPNFKQICWRVPDIREAVIAEPGYLILSADYCIDPNEQVLTSSLEWQQAGNIKLGDFLVGFDEEAEGYSRRRLRKTIVEQTSIVRTNRLRLVTTQGDIICSDLHRWLTQTGSSWTVYNWREARKLKVGYKIAKLCNTWQEDKSWESGYLSGHLDGEGWVHQGVCTGQKPGVVLDQVYDILKSKGYIIKFESNASGVERGRIQGGLAASLEVLGRFRPKRLLAKEDKIWVGQSYYGRYTEPAEILAIEELGEGELIGIQTSTNTLIVNGLLSHNSQIEVKLMAHLSRDPVLIAAINSGKDIHSFNATEVFGGRMRFTYEDMAAAKKSKDHPRHTELVSVRNNIKTVTFGVPYGAGANKVALMTGMTKEAAQEFIDAFFTKFSVLGAWLKKSGDDAIKYGFSLSPRGRRRFYDLPGEAAKEKEKDKIFSQIRRYAGNMPIQSGNVDMLKPAMYQIYNDIRTMGYAEQGARILFCVHDEIVMTAPYNLGCRLDEAGQLVDPELFDKYKKDGIKLIAGPVETILSRRMQTSYDEIWTLHGKTPDIINKIDVAIGKVWEKA